MKQSETLEELDAREERYDRARRIYDDPRSSRGERLEALDEMWRTSLGPAKPRPRAERKATR